jgi:hypothetical protein
MAATKGLPMPKDDATLSAASVGSHGLSEAEIDALEYVVVEGRIACMEDYGILRSLLVRVRPEWETNHDAAPAARAEDVLKEPIGALVGNPLENLKAQSAPAES